MWTSGRHGVPSDSMRDLPRRPREPAEVVERRRRSACAEKRRRPWRCAGTSARTPSPASCATSRSTQLLAHRVSRLGRKRRRLVDERLHRAPVDAARGRIDVAFDAGCLRGLRHRTEPPWLIAWVIPGVSCPNGSLESSAMCTTASKPARSASSTSRMSRESVATVEPAGVVEPGARRGRRRALRRRGRAPRIRTQHCADVPVASGDEHLHRTCDPSTILRP